MSVPSYPGVVPPPPGVTPDLDHPKDAGWSLLVGWLVACNTLVVMAFFARVYVRVWIHRKIFIDDITCAIAAVLILLYSATNALMIHYGQGRHAWEVSPEDYREILKWLYAGSIVYCPAAYFTKITLLLVIARVFAVRERLAKGIHIFIVALLVAYLPMQISKTFICTPIKAFWDDSVNGSCLNQRKIFIADTTIALVTDLIILILPIPLVWTLQVPLRKKMKAAFVLGAGGIAISVTCFRLWAVVQFINSEDVTSDFARQSIAVFIELGIGFICSCVPSINILMERCKCKSSRTPSNHGSQGTSASRLVKSPNNRQSQLERSEPSDSSTARILRPTTPRRQATDVDVDIELGELHE